MAELEIGEGEKLKADGGYCRECNLYPCICSHRRRIAKDAGEGAEVKPEGVLIEAIQEIEAVREVKSGGRYALVFEQALSLEALKRIREHLDAQGEKLGCHFMLLSGPVKIYVSFDALISKHEQCGSSELTTITFTKISDLKKISGELK